jgi:hypothetical protein
MRRALVRFCGKLELRSSSLGAGISRHSRHKGRRFGNQTPRNYKCSSNRHDSHGFASSQKSGNRIASQQLTASPAHELV